MKFTSVLLGAASLGVVLPAQSTTISVSNFNDLKNELDKTCSGTVSNTTIEITSDIVVTSSLRIGQRVDNVTLTSSAGNVFKLTPGASHRDSFLTIGMTWCSGSGDMKDLTIKDLEFSDVTQIQGGITLGPVYIGALTTSATNTITFDNVKFKDNTSPESSSLSPAGLRIDAGHVTIKNSLFDNNSAKGISGAALATASAANITVKDTTFSNNGEDLPLGGAAAYIKGPAVFDTVTFSNNKVDKSKNQNGGALLIDSDDSSTVVSFKDCTFTNNDASLGDDMYIKKDGVVVSLTPCVTTTFSCSGFGCPCGGDDNLDDVVDQLKKGASLGIVILLAIIVGGIVFLAALVGLCICCGCCCYGKKGNVKVVHVVETAQP